MENSKPIVIICAGLNRSGSTWQTNAARLLLEQKFSPDDIYAAWIGDYDFSNKSPVHLVKVHRYNDAHHIIPYRTLTSFRDLRAVAGSLIRMGWSAVRWEDLRHHLDLYVEDAALWEKQADIVTPYERIVEAPLEVITELSHILDIPLSESELISLLRRLDRLEPRTSGPDSHLGSADETTFLHNGHIGDKSNAQASSRVPEPIRCQIEERYGEWLRAHGYSVG